MLILKKSLVLAFVTSCAAFMSVDSRWAGGQVDQDASATIRVADSFKRDAKPFGKAYRHPMPTLDASAFETPAAKANDLSHLASHISKASPIAIPEPSVAATRTNPTKASKVSKPTSAPGTTTSEPNVVVRQPGIPANRMNELSVEVNPVDNGLKDEFAIKVRIPESVKVVELVPVGDASAQRSFNIDLGQTTNRSDAKPIAERTPSSQASSVSVPELPTTNVRSDNTVQAGYQKNPFFDGNSSDPIDKTAHFQPNQLPKFRSVSGRSIKAPSRKLSTNFASYRTTKPLTSLIEGTRMMGLGDTGDFVVYVSNPSTVNANDVVVKLEVPTGLDIVVLDRVAEINKDQRTLAWHLPSITPGQEHLIRYRVKSLGEGQHIQRISVTQGDRDEREIDADEIETSVVLEIDDEAPLLPFESE